MYKYLVFILIILSYATPSNSKAMWEISDEWVCNREYSSKVIVDEDSDVAKRIKEHQLMTGKHWYTGNRINEHAPWTMFFNFKKNIKTGQDGRRSPIVDKLYYYGGGSSKWNNINVIITKLPETPLYSVMEVEEFIYWKEFWGKTTHGPRAIDDGVLSASAWKCLAVN